MKKNIFHVDNLLYVILLFVLIIILCICDYNDGIVRYDDFMFEGENVPTATPGQNEYLFPPTFTPIPYPTATPTPTVANNRFF